MLEPVYAIKNQKRKKWYKWRNKFLILFSPLTHSLGSYSRAFPSGTLCHQFLPESLCIYRCIAMYEHHPLTCQLVLSPLLSVTTVASIAQDEPRQNRWHIHAVEGKLRDSDTNCSIHLSSSLPGNFAKVKLWHSDLPQSRLDITHIWRESENQIPERKKIFS